MISNFKKARLNLVVVYLAIVGSIVALFSFLVVYQASTSFSDLSVKTDADITISTEEARVRAKGAIPDGVVDETEYEIENGSLYFTTKFSDEQEVKVNLITGEAKIPHENESLFATITDDFEEKVWWVALGVFLLASLLCVYIANRTLLPIAQNIQRQKQFVSDAAHELRNPLAALYARAESVLRSGADTFKKDVLEDVLTETKRLITLSESLLSLERGEQERGHSLPQSLQSCFDAVLHRLDHMSTEKNIRINTATDSGMLTIDTSDLETILYNLVHNALKFTKSGGNISILWKDKTLTVSDTGVGILPEHIPHIFERFYKIDTSRSGEGNGLGLAVVKEIAERNGGRISVSSTEGKGTTFMVQFP